MIIRVKLFARLERYLPDPDSRNEADLEVAAGATVGDVIARLGVPGEYCHLVLVNGVFVAPGERAAHALDDGDHLAVWPPVAGGGDRKGSAGGGKPKVVVEKEMAVTHGDFFRTLPRALGTSAYKKTGGRVILADGNRRLEIALGREGERRIAGLTIPATAVTLTLTGYTKAEADAALRRFERMFQKGGG